MRPEEQKSGDVGGTVTDIEPDDWPTWCREATEANGGRTLVMHFSDSALGDVRQGTGQKFISIDHDKLGPAVALTIKYGDGVVPINYVIADPREVQQHRDADGVVKQVTITDGTGRRTFVSLE